MMNINTQFLTIIFSFIFGFIFSLQVSFNYKFIYTSNFVCKSIFTFVFLITNTLLYFIILKIVNNGILHMYGIISILFGYFVEMLVKRVVVKRYKK